MRTERWVGGAAVVVVLIEGVRLEDHERRKGAFDVALHLLFGGG